ncbi:MAG: hypothetical protein LCH67_03975 [Bacteroidetes bacterium]|nr:hypothetical protein [Bacteroidota bacterium]
MVIHGEIISKLLKTKTFKNPKDLIDLIACCEAFPESIVPFSILNNFQADIFKSHLWQKSEEYLAESQEIYRHFIGITKENTDSNKKTKIKNLDFKEIISTFANNFREKRTEFYNKLNLFPAHYHFEVIENKTEDIIDETELIQTEIENIRFPGTQTEIKF